MTMKISSATRAFLDERFGSDYDPSRGYTSEEAAEARRRFRSTVEISSSNNDNNQDDVDIDDDDDDDDDEGHYNVVKAPINCPPWICCLLPCLTKIPSMKAFKAISPEDAEVLRRQAPRGGGGRKNNNNATSLTSQWIRYDATSLVCGDVIRLEEGDIVPADCLVVEVMEANQRYEDDVEQQKGGAAAAAAGVGSAHRRRPSLLVDSRAVTGEDKPRSIPATLCMDNDEASGGSSSNDEKQPEKSKLDAEKMSSSSSTTSNFQQRQLHWGATVVQGRCIAIVTAIGSHTLVSRLIRSGKFPAKENVFLNTTTLMNDDGNDIPVHQHGPTDEDEEDAEAGISLLAARKNNATTSSVV